MAVKDFHSLTRLVVHHTNENIFGLLVDIGQLLGRFHGPEFLGYKTPNFEDGIGKPYG
jgi:hypothetical protein